MKGTRGAEENWYKENGYLIDKMSRVSTMEVVPGVNLTRIRKTDERPPRVSVLDLIRVVSRVVNPNKTWADLKKGHPDVILTESYHYCNDYRLSNQGPKGSPVINANGAISIINILPGTLAASFRAAWSNIISRYIGGDVTLGGEIDRNRAIASQVENDDPIRLFGQTLEANDANSSTRALKVVNGIPKEQYQLTVQENDKIVTNGLIDPKNPQVYAGIPKQIKLPPSIPVGATIIKFGYTSCSGQRVGAHRDSYGGFEYLSTFHCANAYRAEQRFKEFLKTRGRLVTGIRLNGTPDTELFWVVSQEEWEEFAREFKRICEDIIANYCQTERDLLRLRLAEIDLEKEREKTKQAEADSQARIAEAQVRQLEIGRKKANEEQGELVRTESIDIEIEDLIDGGGHAEGAVDKLRDVGEADVEDVGTVVNDHRAIEPDTDSSPDIVLRPARRRQPTLPTDVQDFPFQPFLDTHLEPEQDLNRGLQWKDLKVRFQMWHAGEFPRERLNKSFPKSIQDYFSSKLGGWHDTSRAGVKVKGFFGWRLRDLPQAPPERQMNTVSQGTLEVSRTTSSPPLSGNAVQRAERDIVRILDEIEGGNRELNWGDLVARRNPLINERTMIRGRANLLAQGRLFKRPVMGNTCVYSLC